MKRISTLRAPFSAGCERGPQYKALTLREKVLSAWSRSECCDERPPKEVDVIRDLEVIDLGMVRDLEVVDLGIEKWEYGIWFGVGGCGLGRRRSPKAAIFLRALRRFV
jgi:hypothetical protein